MSTNRLKYPYHWGRGIVDSFVEKYSRGTYFLSRLWGKDKSDVRHELVIALCRGNSMKYESLKRVVKVLEQYTKADIDRFSYAEKRMLSNYLEILAQDDELDSRIEREAIDTWRNRPLF